MTIRAVSLASGSDGNSYLVQAGGRAILIDAGISARRLKESMALFGVSPDDLDAILISHEHSDHHKGLSVLSRKATEPIPVVINEKTLEKVEEWGGPIERPIILPTGGSISIGSFEVSSFPIPHDVVDPVGYHVSVGGHNIVVATDMGHVTMEVLEALEDAHLAVVESNYDRESLIHGPYPEYLKDRISSGWGHLSNHESALAIANVSQPEKEFWLGHLSRHNNTKELALESVKKFLTEQGVSATVRITERSSPSLTWER